MTRVGLLFLLVTATLICVAAFADRHGLTRPLWERLLPDAMLSEASGALAEQQSKLLAERDLLRAGREARAVERRGDLDRLSHRLEPAKPQDPAAARIWLTTDKVAAALVAAIDKYDVADADDCRKIAELEARIAELEASIITMKSGGATALAARPSDVLRAETVLNGTLEERYERILRQATSRR